MTLRYPEWQKPYRAALLEVDPKKLSSLVAKTESAIFSRLRWLAFSSDGDEERQAIADANHALLTLKQDILKFPAL